VSAPMSSRGLCRSRATPIRRRRQEMPGQRRCRRARRCRSRSGFGSRPGPGSRQGVRRSRHSNFSTMSRSSNVWKSSVARTSRRSPLTRAEIRTLRCAVPLSLAPARRGAAAHHPDSSRCSPRTAHDAQPGSYSRVQRQSRQLQTRRNPASRAGLGPAPARDCPICL
jgi:hypothetical protein